MNLTGYVEALRQQLAVAAAAGGDEAQALAERLTAPLDAATPLGLLGGRAGLSVNAWLVRAANAALDGHSGYSGPGDQGDRMPREDWRAPRGGQRFTGWVR